MKSILFATLLLIGSNLIAAENPKVLLHTSMGDITLELNTEKAPISTANFLQYVRDGFYSGTVFHRVISYFMIQGGGMRPDLSRKTPRAPIKNEAPNGLKNLRGTIAMARTSDPDSATSQFFINVQKNKALDYESGNADKMGYAVFGKVIDGMDVVDDIRFVETGSTQGMTDVPVETVTIISAKILTEK